jgi:lipopolysaccharide export system protein LptC
MNKSMNSRLAKITAALAFAVCIIVYVLYATQPAHHAALSADATMTELKSKVYDKNGLLTRSLVASKMQHFNKSNISIFRQPNMQMQTTGGQSWQITAKKGASKDNQNTIKLYENVKFYRPATDKYMETTITTEQATIYQHSKTMTSDKAVVFTRSDCVITGIGVKANLADGMILIKNKVHAIYDNTTKA